MCDWGCFNDLGRGNCGVDGENGWLVVIEVIVDCIDYVVVVGDYV